MAFVPVAVPTEETFVSVRDEVLGEATTPIQSLKWPGHRRVLWRLTLAQKQAWYAAQDPQELIDMDSNQHEPLGPREYARVPEFRRWWFWHYLLPLRFKRLAYKLKFW